MSEDNSELFNEIQTYLNLQSELISLTKRCHAKINKHADDGLILENLRNIPSPILLKGEEWLLKPHGIGILFKNKTTNVEVDVHIGMEEESIFDEWRLYTYLKSIRFPLRVNEQKRINFTSDELLAELSKLEQSKKISAFERYAGHFRITESN